MKINVGPERMVLTDGLQPFMFRTSRGTIFVQAQLSYPSNYVKPAANVYPGPPGSAVSRDGGKTWSRWFPKAEQEPGPCIEGAVTELPNGDVMLIDWIAEGPDEKGTFVGKRWVTRDDFVTIEGPEPCTATIPNAKAGFDDNGHPYRAVTFHRSIVAMPNGDLLAPVYGWMVGDDSPVKYQPKMLKYRLMLLRSRDQGKTWQYVTTMAAPLADTEEGFNESVMVRTPSGKLVTLVRTGSQEQPIYQVTSDDEGQTWTQPRKLDIKGVSPDLIVMHDGTLVGLTGYRIWEDRDIKKRVYQIITSRDEGATWSIDATFGTRPHSGMKQHTSYGAICQMKPGKLLAMFDIGVWSASVRYVACRVLTVTS
jgi:hypothetical protein